MQLLFQDLLSEGSVTLERKENLRRSLATSKSGDVTSAGHRMGKEQFHFPFKIPMPFPLQL